MNVRDIRKKKKGSETGGEFMLSVLVHKLRDFIRI